jgi:hypothetical protein
MGKIMAVIGLGFLFFFMLVTQRSWREPLGITPGQAVLGGVLAIVGIDVALLLVYRKTRRR